MHKTGDLVRLKSGGPVMTVSFIASQTVGCDWFDEENRHQTANFRPEQLVPAEDK